MRPIPIPSILDRSEGYMTIQFKNDPDILGYRILVADSLNNAYGPFNGVSPTAGTGPERLFDLERGQTLRTKDIRLRGLGVMGDITRGQTRATYDPNEFYNPPTTLVVPPDNWHAFMRVQVRTVASPQFPVTVEPANMSKIVIMRSPYLNVSPRPALTLYGTAPTIATAVPGLPLSDPYQAMVVSIPSFADSLTVSNTGPGDLLFAAGLDHPLMLIQQGDEINVTGATVDTLVFCAVSGNPNFSILSSTVNTK